jgi:hypothetical protein
VVTRLPLTIAPDADFRTASTIFVEKIKSDGPLQIITHLWMLLLKKGFS